jgi:lipoprotein-anchoring transpeptidase ErfK/SrfK
VRSRGRLNAAIAAVAGVLALAFLAACQTGSATSATGTSTPPSASPVTSAAPVKLTIEPADGTIAVSLDAAVKVSAVNGAISTVSVVDADGGAVKGTLDATAHSWASTDVLMPDMHYLVTATAIDADGQPTSQSTSFTTAAPAKVLGVKIAPLEGEIVGVGMPIVVYFTAAVTDKAAVERALTVDMSQDVLGAWHWYGSKEVHYRPVEYWPAGEEVTLHADLRGVNAGKGVWGVENRTLHFTVGDSHIATVDAKTHTMSVAVNGAVVRTALVSTGRDQYPTTSGVHVVLEKTPSIIMDSATVGIPKGNPDYYYEKVDWDVRISWSGEFVHSAPWSTSAQGHANVSHGCVNASPADAQWYYNLARRGDIVVVTNTGRPLASGNGWTDWNMDWKHWLAGSAIYGGAIVSDPPAERSTGSTPTKAATIRATPSKPAAPSLSATPSASPSTSVTVSPSPSLSVTPSASPSY